MHSLNTILEKNLTFFNIFFQNYGIYIKYRISYVNLVPGGPCITHKCNLLIAVQRSTCVINVQ